MKLFHGGKAPPPTYRRAIKNIRATYLDAPDMIKDWGINWYKRAHEEAVKLAAEAKVPVRAACHAIAALSPTNRWDSNLRDAKKLVAAITTGKPFHSFNVSTYTRNKRKAWEIIRLARSGRDYEKILSGPKVTSFADNIEFPEKNKEVTVDFHAYSIAVGWRFTSKEVPSIEGKTYAMLRKAYATVGEEFGIKAHQVQAVTWVWWRKKRKV